MTNREKINNMSNDELSLFIFALLDCDCCKFAGKCELINKECTELWCEWFESEVEE